jgi:Fic family protein
MDVTAWLKWFLGALERSVTNAHEALDIVLQKARFWQTWDATPLNARQIKLLNRLLDGFDGKFTSSRWAYIAKCSPDTALRDITQLIYHGILEKTSSGGRSTAYRLASSST